METSILAIDLAKSVFQLHGSDLAGKCTLRKKLRRNELMVFVANMPKCTIAMEACSGANHWGREFRKFGHDVRLIAPQFVKPFVKTNKNDANDAEAIAEAALRPNMRFVPVKEIWQQDLLALHRARSLLIGHRVALTNSIRGLLAEHGHVFQKSDGALQKYLVELFNKEEVFFSALFKNTICQLWNHFKDTVSKIKEYDQQIEKIAKENEACLRIQKIEGIGPITATAIVGAVGDAKAFKNGRQFSAFLGLVPRQSSSGGKQRLLGISKRGDVYIRKLLVHGARSAIRCVGTKTNRRALWVIKKIESRGHNKACVALANRNARVVWALLSKGEEYKMAA